MTTNGDAQMRLKGRTLSTSVALSMLVLSGSAAAQGLVPHRAVYDLSLYERSDRSGITGISGRMVYEVEGSECDGYTVNFRFVTEFVTEDFSRLIDEQSTTHEGPDGESFDFATRSFLDGQLDRETRGTATPANGGTHVVVERPDQVEYELGPSLFPTQHLKDLLDKIGEGRTFYETTIFDGSEAGSKVMTTTVVVGREGRLGEGNSQYAPLREIGDLSYWPVNIAYFDLGGGDDSSGEGVPTYRIAFKLHESGVSHDLVMDYGDFAIAGDLTELELFRRGDDCE
jgi:hypothetical protein